MNHLFFARFLISSLATSAIILIVLLVKRVLKKHISTRWQYNIWFLVIVMLIIPFVPNQLINFGSIYNWTNNINMNGSITADNLLLSSGENNPIYSTIWLQDLTLSVSRSSLEYLSLLFMGIWVLGMVIFTIATIRCNYDIKYTRRSIQPLQNEEIKKLFEQCKDDLRITQKLVLGESALVQTPTIMGFLRTYVILPIKITKQLSMNDIKYIFLHELKHYKNKDILVNYVMCFFQILYWFNPLVWAAFKVMRTDREIACDISVLKMLDESCYIDYGRTIINFAEKLSQPSYMSITTDMGGSKQQIISRIEKIALFTTESKQLKMKSIAIFVFIGFIIFSQSPIISAMTYRDNKYDLEKKQPVYEDLGAYFYGFDGSFVLYDLQASKYSIYNKDKSISRVSPNSTYKIFSALIALELNVIQDGDSTLSWNGTNYPFQVWNKNQNLSSAMINSVSWYFQDLDKLVGLKNLQTYFKQIGYGNHNLSGGLSNYWIESSLCISPVEQVQLLKDFYTNNMPFREENINAVKDVLKLSEKDNAILYGKTGTGLVNESGNGWFIGYVEKEGNAFIFATNIQGNHGASGSTAAKIALSILSDKSIY